MMADNREKAPGKVSAAALFLLGVAAAVPLAYVAYDLADDRPVDSGMLREVVLALTGVSVGVALVGALLLVRAAGLFRGVARRLSESEERNRAILAGAEDAFVSIDAEGRIRTWGGAAEKLLGWNESEALGGPLAELVILPSGRADFHAALRAYVNSGEWVTTGAVESEVRHREGHLVPVEVRTHPWGDGEQSLFNMWLRDVSERREYEAAVAHYALHDQLTGVANRKLLEDRLAMALARAERSGAVTAVLFIDLDDFAQVNDKLGQHAGDQLLCGLADRLVHFLRPSDTVARFGGDEFVILCEDVGSVEIVQRIAERLIVAINDPVSLEEFKVRISASVGIAAAAGRREDAPMLLRAAEAAMTRTKTSGKNGWEIVDMTGSLMEGGVAGTEPTVISSDDAADNGPAFEAHEGPAVGEPAPHQPEEQPDAAVENGDRAEAGDEEVSEGDEPDAQADDAPEADGDR